MCVCCFCTVDDGAGVKAAVLLAPVGSDAGALWEIAHGWRLHIDDLRTHKRKRLLNVNMTQRYTHAKGL